MSIQNALKWIAVTAVTATTLSFAPTTASAEDLKLGINIGGRGASIEFGNHDYRESQQIHYRGGSRHSHSGYRERRHGHHNRGHGRRWCGPRKAMDKAWNMGLNRPYIKRIGENRIVVGGYKRGYDAKIVFAKHSRRCEVIKVRGLGQRRHSYRY